MSRYVVAPRAQQDIDEIYEKIYSEDPAVAERFERKVYETFDLIVDFPGIGHPRRDLVGDRPVLFHTIMRKAFAIVYQKADRAFSARGALEALLAAATRRVARRQARLRLATHTYECSLSGGGAAARAARSRSRR